MSKKLRVLECFSGIGACSKALDRLGVDYEIVDSVEIDKYAVQSFNAIHGTNFEPQDITKWDKDIEADLIMHGSPCQDFSVAGLGAGGDKGSGTRSSLMYETLRIVAKLKPKYVIWENVKNLLSTKHKHNFDAYIEAMKNLGYVSHYRVLNAKDFGVPQNRERVYTISIRNDLAQSYDFPEGKPLEIRLKDILESEVDEKYYLSEERLEKIKIWDTRQRENGRGFRFETKTENDIAQTVTTNSDRLSATTYIEEKPIRIGGMYDKDGEKHQAGGIYDSRGVSPTLDTCSGGNRMPIVTENTEKTIECNHNPKHQQNPVQDENGICKTIPAGTHDSTPHLLKTAVRKPQVEFVGGIGETDRIGDGKELSRNYPQGNRVYSTEGVAVSQTAQGGGLGGPSGLYLEEAQPVKRRRSEYGKEVRKDYEKHKLKHSEDMKEAYIADDGIMPTITASKREQKIAEPYIAASRGRSDGDWKDTDHYQRLEPRTDGLTNTISSVQKDNYVVVGDNEKPITETPAIIQKQGDRGTNNYSVNSENAYTIPANPMSDRGQMVVERDENFVEKAYNEFAEKNGYTPEIFNPYNRAEIADVAPTQTTQAGSTTSSATVLIKDKELLKTKLCNNLIEKGIVSGGEIINHSYTTSEQRPTLDKYIENKEGIMPTLTTRPDCLGYVEPQPTLRIRKLTPKETWRLMSFDDEDFDKAAYNKYNDTLEKLCSAKLKGVIEKREQNGLATYALNITNALQELGITSTVWTSLTSESLNENIPSANVAIEMLDGRVHLDSAISITKCLENGVTLCTLMDELDQNPQEVIIGLGNEGKGNTEKYMKITLAENLNPQRLFIILTLIKLITKLKIYGSTLLTLNIQKLTINYADYGNNTEKMPTLSLEMVATTTRVSNSALYKQAGNSIVVNVLEAILKNLIPDGYFKTQKNVVES